MALLKPATNQTAFLKVGTLGFEGSGKTRTAVELAIGMTKQVKGTKVAFFDTEKGSDFHIERFKKAGIELHVVKSKSFKDLVDTIWEAEKNGYSFLIIDSITHVWRELTDSYLRTQTRRKHLTMKDWGVLKSEWAQYTDGYVNSKLHIAMCGRAGHEYDIGEDDDGNQEIRKSGTKMKVETETGYEPDLLIEMIKVPNSEVMKDKKGKTDRKAKGWVNRAVILKDRTDLMNGAHIDYPTFKHFEPIVKFLNIGGEHVGTSVRNSDSMFGSPDRSWSEEQKRKEIAIEQLSDLLIQAGLSGTSKDAVQKRTDMLVRHLGGSGQTHIKNLALETLLYGIKQIREESKVEAPISPIVPKANGVIVPGETEADLPF